MNSNDHNQLVKRYSVKINFLYTHSRQQLDQSLVETLGSNSLKLMHVHVAMQVCVCGGGWRGSGGCGYVCVCSIKES